VGKSKPKKKLQPPQHQREQPGKEHLMRPQPESKARDYKAAGKLEGKVAVITGGDSGIGRSVAVHFAMEGADVSVIYLSEHKDAQTTRDLIEQAGRRCLLISGDVGDSSFCKSAVDRTARELGGLDIVVNNAAEQHPVESIEELTDEQLEKTFRTNIFAYFYLTRAAMKHLKEGAVILCTTSITAYEGHDTLLDYAATKGAIVTFVRSMAKALAEKKIRVNGVAPGPIWTPLIPASFPAEKVETFGSDTPLGRPGQPDEVAPCYVFLASDDSSYMTGQILHPNGGRFMTT
jgi:NAD(P)-dependent dehydrogenase (short-subunit alcohol dehydrogenase family)